MSRRLQARTDFRSPLAGCPGGQFEVRGYDIALDLGEEFHSDQAR